MRSLITLLICLSACAKFPALEGTISDTAREAPYPVLSPIPPELVDPQSEPKPSLAARIAALNARAARLRSINIAALQ